MTNWVVHVEPGAFEHWRRTAMPPPQTEDAVLVWLDELQQSGPPSIVGYSGAFVPCAEAPHGVVVEFVVIAEPLSSDEPPYGIIAIRRIGSP